jgi:perosamine synthetase
VLKIPFFKTYINKSCEDIVNSTLKSNFLNEGLIVDKFEDRIRKFLNVKYINTTNSGTSALHLSLIASGIGPGDEVILSPQTFVATGLVVKYCGAKPVFCDIQIDTGNICPKSIEKKLSNDFRLDIFEPFIKHKERRKKFKGLEIVRFDWE